MIQAITLLAIAALVIIDQITKYLVVSNLNVGDTAFSIPHFIEITYVKNFGGMMGTFSGMAKILGFATIAIIIGGIILLCLKKIKPAFPYVCVTMIIAGGVGNLIDRLRFGYVIDFINVLFVKFYVFNFADCLVTVGAFLLIFYEIYLIFIDSKKKGEENA